MEGQSVNLAFDDLISLIDVIIDQWRRINNQTRVLSKKPILKISDNYVVAKPLTVVFQESIRRTTELLRGYREHLEEPAPESIYCFVWTASDGQDESVYQLQGRLGSNYITIFLDFQGLAPQIKKDNDFWRLMSKQIRRDSRNGIFQLLRLQM